jgi:uncharacterized HAD superfamily protein
MDTQIKKRTIDNDDVLYPSTPHFCCKFHNQKYGTKTKMEDFTSFDIVSLWGISELDWWIREREFYKTKMYADMEPLPGAHELLEYLSMTGESHLLTGRGKDVEHFTFYKLRKDFKPHHFKGMHHTGPEFFDGPRESKAEVCKRIGAHILIDDLHTTLIGAAQQNITGILMTQPWNKRITDLPKNIYRARNLFEARDIIDKHNL